MIFTNNIEKLGRKLQSQKYFKLKYILYKMSGETGRDVRALAARDHPGGRDASSRLTERALSRRAPQGCPGLTERVLSARDHPGGGDASALSVRRVKWTFLCAGVGSKQWRNAQKAETRRFSM